MKFYKIILLFITVSLGFLFGCTPEDSTVFDQNLLIGKWQSGTLHYRYDTGGSGVTWDTADDVTEAEAQAFTWTLVKSDLTHIYVTEMGMDGTKVGIPKVYTVETLTASQLVYSDAFGRRYSFTKNN
jgi:hypothetical protein